jgi:adenine-specific DNA-methyltransferase
METMKKEKEYQYMSRNPAFDKLIRLLKELFQLDQPDLDFGLYRIMHARAREISQFLDRDLLPQVQEAFSLYRTVDKADLEKELAQVIEQANNLGVDPETSPKVQDLRRKIAEQGVDVTGLAHEVYDHLYKFFRRYYHEGDFLAKRVYKPGVYAIPYEGEEVKLHWANKDQYYIKTSEHLRDYAFALKPGAKDDPMRVHFRLKDAAEGEHGNIKAGEEQHRVFILAKEDFIAEEDGESGRELVIRFEYRPATLADWSETARAQATDAAGKKPPIQKVLHDDAVRRILAIDDPILKHWLMDLAQPHIKANGEPAEYSRLAAHLNRYTAKNTFDYFIHKDLGGFLRRELDFYIKTEVMHLDDIESETAPRVEQYLSKIKVIRQIAGKIIDFLAQLENFQKKLWLKKKFVTETSWCIRVGRIPEAFYPAIAANDQQRKEWISLHAIDEIQGDMFAADYSEPLTPEFLKAHPTLMVDTRHFGDGFAQQLLEAMGDIDGQTDGVLFHCENFQALSLMQARYRGQIRSVYIDPPYNAQSTEILYKNTYKHASWLSLMQDRFDVSLPLLEDVFVYVTAIDEVENIRLGQILSDLFQGHEIACISIMHNPTGQQGKNFSFTHEFAYFVFPKGIQCIGLENRDDHARESSADIRPLRNVSSGSNHLRESAANCFYPIYVKDGEIIGFGDVCSNDFHPQSRNILKEDNLIEVYPIDPSNKESKWVFARDTVESIRNELSAVFDETKNLWDIVRRKGQFRYKSLWHDKRYSANSWGSVVLNNILDNNTFTYPKSIFTVRDCIDASLNNSKTGVVLDYFAGSGTTGHAVINLNREDKGHRKFILAEMGDYFDTVLLPRLKKVTFTPEWKAGKPKRLATAEEAERSPRIMKVIRLESYEDALNNLALCRDESQESLLAFAEARGPGGLREQYLLRYMLDVETRGSRSLLNIAAFTDPTAYRLKVKRPGSEETREINVDLLETFNWLIGLTVDAIAAPRTIAADFTRDTDPDLPKDAPRRLLLDGQVREDSAGPWWFRTVAGTTPDGRRTLVIWRKLTGDPEQDNLVLDEWFKKQGYADRDSEFDLIYVNGDNNLENLCLPGETWNVRLIEEDFHRLMFEEAEA